MKIYTTPRPYTLALSSGLSYPLSSESAQRLIDSYAVVTATKHLVVLRGDDGYRTTIRPATLGGGAAFIIEKQR